MDKRDQTHKRTLFILLQNKKLRKTPPPSESLLTLAVCGAVGRVGAVVDTVGLDAPLLVLISVLLVHAAEHQGSE